MRQASRHDGPGQIGQGDATPAQRCMEIDVLAGGSFEVEERVCNGGCCTPSKSVLEKAFEEIARTQTCFQRTRSVTNGRCGP